MKFILLTLILHYSISSLSQTIEFGEGGEKQLDLFKPQSKISYKMARGEYEITSVKFPLKTVLKDYKLTWLKSPNLAKVQPQLQIYFLATHYLNKRSGTVAATEATPQNEWADIVIPLKDLTTIKIPKANQPQQPLWLMEWYSNSELLPGLYQAKIEWLTDDKQSLSTLIDISVSSVILENPFQLKTSFGFAPWSALKKHYGGWHADEFQLYDLYYKMAKDHKIELHKLYTRFSSAKKQDPLMDGSDQDPNNFINIMKKWAPNIQIITTDLPIEESYKSADPQFEIFWKNLNSSILKHQIGKQSFVYFKDEPQAKDIPEIKTRLTQIKKWAPDVKFLLVSDYYKELDGLIDIWVVNLWSLQQKDKPNLSFYQSKQQANKFEFWIYVSCNSHGCDGAEEHLLPDLVVDHSLTKTRSFAWSALALGAKGLLYYDTVYGYGLTPTNSPWTDTFSFTGVGEGNLFYPCTQDLGGCLKPQVFSSLRLKILRDGLEDVQLFNQTQTIIPWDGFKTPISLETIILLRAKSLNN